jgi:hypothetical protein
MSEKALEQVCEWAGLLFHSRSIGEGLVTSMGGLPHNGWKNYEIKDAQMLEDSWEKTKER